MLKEKYLNLKVADYIGQYLVGHYELRDMRTVEGNIWQKVLEE